MREECPNCGAPLPPGAKACPECGSDEETGWSEGATAEGLDLPDDSFVYKDFTKREFGDESPVPRGLHWFWWLVGLAVVAGMIWFCFGRL